MRFFRSYRWGMLGVREYGDRAAATTFRVLGVTEVACSCRDRSRLCMRSAAPVSGVWDINGDALRCQFRW